MKTSNINNIDYHCAKYTKNREPKESIKVIGLDTEALTNGKMFMLCTSHGDIFTPDDIPQCFFTRKYRSSNFVVYNLKYDEGAILQKLPKENLKELWKNHVTEYQGYKYKIIPRKCLIIRRGKNAVTFYDIANFFKKSLNEVSQLLLNESKIELDTNLFTKEYVKSNWNKISEYCIKDAILTKKLADLLIHKFESFGIKPQKLYSTAYVSYQYFRTKCNYPVVRRYWKYHPKVLDYALKSYSGGKFEVTIKGSNYYYEYDINSAYASEISDLEDIENSEIFYTKEYIKNATYGFIDCTFVIPLDIYNPIAHRTSGPNIFPVGQMRKIITKKEYEYLKLLKVEIVIHGAWWLFNKEKVYPFRKEILKLTKLKNSLKVTKNTIDYYILKKLLNSLYGKFIQLIEKDGRFIASTCWNPIYGSIITANTRLKVTELQQRYKSIVAVHTDSLISSEKLPLNNGNKLGKFNYVLEGEGIILGCGVYQIGKKSKFRGLPIKKPLLDIISSCKHKHSIDIKRPISWREVAFHNWDIELINQFKVMQHNLSVNFDKKRLWLNDWKKFSECTTRNVYSLPHYLDDFLML